MGSFDSKYQERENGPLSKALRARIAKFRGDYTLNEIGEALGFSGAFISSLLNEKTPGRIRTIHIPGIVRELEDAEKRHAGQLTAKATSKSQAKNEKDLAYHLRAIDRLGFKITGIAPK